MDEATLDEFLEDLQALQDKYGVYIRDEGAAGDFSPHLCERKDDELGEIAGMVRYWLARDLPSTASADKEQPSR